MKRFPSPGTGLCDAVVCDGVVDAVANDPVCADGITKQTQNTLQELERLLTTAGSGRAGLIQATVYLPDMTDKPEMNKVWLDWIGPQENWPQRACVGVGLTEGYLIEVVAMAKVL